MSKIRVRFAPSPTGSLHIGGARTALFNWLYARRNGGDFVLRLEDTDLERSKDDSARGIIDGLRWLGLNWDEGPDCGGDYGPYRQSQRLEIYSSFLQQLIDEKKAYYCFCLPDELQKEKSKAQEQKTTYKYSGRCRSLSPKEIQERLNRGMRPVVRIAAPQFGLTIVDDLIRGHVEFSNQLMDDFIIAKADGWPTYNFAVVVDDHTMKITHVIRAEEHLSNTPKQIAIYNALGWQHPQFAHVSMILSPDRSKLSKRHGATSVQEFREAGYLPEALLNYLALLGWSSGTDQDFWTLPELVEGFSLDKISRSPAVYDVDKLTWMNGHYIDRCDPDRLYSLLQDEASSRRWPVQEHPDYFKQIISLVKSRAKTTRDILEQADYFFQEPQYYDPKGVKKYFQKENSAFLLEKALELCSKCPDFKAFDLENHLRLLAEDLQVKAAELIHPIRLAISGRTNTPGLFEIMEILGRERCLARLKKARAMVSSADYKSAE